MQIYDFLNIMGTPFIRNLKLKILPCCHFLISGHQLQQRDPLPWISHVGRHQQLCPTLAVSSSSTVDQARPSSLLDAINSCVVLWLCPPRPSSTRIGGRLCQPVFFTYTPTCQRQRAMFLSQSAAIRVRILQPLLCLTSWRDSTALTLP